MLDVSTRFRALRRVGIRSRGPLALIAVAFVAAACGDPQVPTTATPLTSQTSVAVVASALTSFPSVRVLDAKGKGMKNVLVRWTVAVGSGKVVNDSVRTNSSGEASSGGWTLGTTAGLQTLTATAEGISAPVTFTATATPGAPARVVRVSPDQQQGIVNTNITVAPSARVEDTFGNPVPGVNVVFSTAPGDGTIVGAQQVTNSLGIATATSWQLGTTARVQIATASTGNLIAAAFFSIANAGAPVDLVKAGGDNQEGLNGSAITTPPGVRVVDAFGNPVGGIPVTFTPGPNSGTISGTVVQTDPATGIAAVGSWVLGTAAVQTLIATSTAVPGKNITFTASITTSAFRLDVRFIGDGGTARQRQAFTNAAAKWRKVIVGHVHDVRIVDVGGTAGACGSDWVPPINEVISDLVIFARITPIDGSGKILAQAGPCSISTASRLTLFGIMEFDQDDLPGLLTNGTIDDVVLHEMGHVLGIGTLWNFAGRRLLSGSGGVDPFFTGVAARAEFPSIGGAIYSGTPVPVENTGSAGTRDSHWRNSIFNRELMQGFAASGGMPLSRVTAASLTDLGYVVNLNAADAFRLPGASLMEAFPGSMTVLENDVANTPLYEFGSDGSRRKIRDKVKY